MMENKQSQKWAITLLTIGVFMAGLDNGIISTALTTINHAFGVSPSWGTWSVTLYTLGIAISVPIIGKLSDKFGRKRMFIIEIILFGIGSLLVALSPSFWFLLMARFIQSIGGGGIFIIGSAHVLATMPKDKQGKALGIMGGMHGLSSIVGPNLGAVILGITGSWQWLFIINIPIAIFLILFGYMKIPETRASESMPLDLKGSIILAVAILAMMFGLTNLDSQAFLNSLIQPSVGLLVVFGIVLLLFFIRHEQNLENHGGDPIIAFSLLKRRPFQLTLLLGFLSGGFLAGIIFIPTFVQQVLQVPVEHAGYWLTPLAIASGIGAGLGGVLTDKKGAARAVVLSGMIGVLGFLLFPLFVHGFWMFTVASILAGMGLGILLGAPLNVLVGESASDGQHGSALGALSLIRQVGLTLFPTIYAGFITGAFTKIGDTITEKYAEVLSTDTFSEQNYGALMDEVNGLSQPHLKEKIIHMITTTLKNGFDHMYMTTIIASLLVTITGMYLVRRRKVN